MSAFAVEAMFEVSVSACFAASHQLRRADGSYEPQHAHDWRVKVTYAGDELNEAGVLVDFVAVRARLNAVLAGLHEQHLNELPAFTPAGPSAENVAAHVAKHVAAEATPGAILRCVEVEEEPGCVACYWPGRTTAASRHGTRTHR